MKEVPITIFIPPNFKVCAQWKVPSKILQILPYFFLYKYDLFCFSFGAKFFFSDEWSISMWARAIIIQKNKPNEKQKSKIGFS